MNEIKLGKLISKGETVDVYKSEDGKLAVKIFNPDCPKTMVFYEALMISKVEETGLNLPTVKEIEQKISKLKQLANEKGYPIDGIVFTFDSASFSKEQGRTSHHFKDGIAYKFGS